MDSVIIFTAKYVIGLIVLVLAYVWFRQARPAKLQLAIKVVLAGILALLFSRLASKLYYDPRPFVKSVVKPLIDHAPDNGFPSDHALLSMTLTAVLYFYSKKWALTGLVLTVAVSAARVLAHVHSPIDILGAWLIGVLAALAANYIVNILPWFKNQSTS